MSVDRANLVGAGAPKVTFNGATFWTRDDVVATIGHNLVDQRSTMFGRVTRTKSGRKIETQLPIYGLWRDLSVLFPSAIVNPTIGARLFTGADLPMVLHAKNQDRLTLHNTRITGLANLRLAANAQIFSGAVTFTSLLKNNADPADAASYFTYDTAAYVEGDFALSTAITRAWSGAWGARTGFTAMQTEAGWEVNWELRLEDDQVDGLGPVDMFIQEFSGSARCVPVGPTLAQVQTNLFYQGDAKAAVGAGLHESVDDLVITSGTASLTLKNAGLVSAEVRWSPSAKRMGTCVWETTRGFTAGAPQATAVVA
jgi:hypothetical protein